MKIFTIKKLILCLVMLVSASSIFSQVSFENIEFVRRINSGIKAPVRMTIDHQDHIFVTDVNRKQILKFDTTGNLLEEIDPGVIPLSLAVDPANKLFFGDAISGAIYRLETDGSKTLFYPGTQFPNSMVFDADGLLYVVDSKLNKVIVLDLSANVVRTIGEGTFLFPTGIAYNKNNNRIYVAEHGGLGSGFTLTTTVWMFEPEGTLVGNFGKYGSADGQFYRIQGLTAGKCGNIFISDPFQGQISIFDEEGIFISKFGEFGDSLGQLNVPLDIIFDSKERAFVSSMNNGALEVYRITDTLPAARFETQNTVICSGETAVLEISFTGTAPWSFRYTIDGLDTVDVNNSTENPYILTVSEPGTYEIVSLSDVNYTGSCFTGNSKVSVNTEAPTSVISTGDTLICSGDTTDIVIHFTGMSPWTFTYTKDGQNPANITTTNNPYILPVAEPGKYEVVALEGGGCTGKTFTGSTNLTVKPRPSANISQGNDPVPICPGETADLTVELTGAAPWSFTYVLDEENPISVKDVTDSLYTISVSKKGTYEVTLVTDQYCFNTKSTGYPDVVYMPTSEIKSRESTICEGETTPIEIDFTGIPPWTFTYQVDGIIKETISDIYTSPYILKASEDGLYEVAELSDGFYAGDCFTGSATVKVNPLPIAGFSYMTNALEVSFTDSSSNAGSYLWDFGDGSTSTEINPVHVYQKSGEYTVSLKVSNDSCGDNTAIETIALTETPVEVTGFGDLLKLYPNPSNGMVTIEMNNPLQSEVRIDIFTTGGVLIYSDVFSSRNVVEQIDLSSLKKGLYFVRIYSNEFTDIQKLIISHRKK